MSIFLSLLDMSRIIRVCLGVGDRKCGAFLSSVDRDPHPTCTRCRGRVCTMDMTCDICTVWSVAQWEQFVKKRTYKERKRASHPSGSVPPAPLASPRAETSSGVSRPGTSSSSSHPLGGQGKQEGSQGAPVVVSGGAPSPPARPRSSERGGSASGQSSGARGHAPPSPSPSGAGEVGAARSQQTPTSRASASVVSPQSLLHVQRREDSRETSESCPRVLSSLGSRSSDRRGRSRTSSSRGRRPRSHSLSSSRSRSRGRERRRRSSSRSLSSRARLRRDRSLSFDRYRSRRGSSRSGRDQSRYRSRRDRSQRERLRSVDRYHSRRQRTCSPARWGGRSDRSRSHALPNRSRDSSRSRGRLPGSPARSRVEEPGRLAR